MSTPTTNRAAVRRIIRALKDHGWVLASVYDSEETIATRTEAAAIEAIMAVDEATLVVHEGTLTGPRGWVYFVHNPDPVDTICDYTINLSSVIDPLMDEWI